MSGAATLSKVSLSSLALLKIVQHGTRALPELCAGSLLGLDDGHGCLEVTDCFGYPSASAAPSADEDDDDAAALAEELGIGRSSAYSIVKKLRGRLIELAGDDERSREVLAALVRLVLDGSSGVPSLENVDMENSRVI